MFVILGFLIPGYVVWKLATVSFAATGVTEWHFYFIGALFLAVRAAIIFAAIFLATKFGKGLRKGAL
jgi:hypothetical protein